MFFYLITNLKPNPSGYAVKLHKPLLSNVVDITGDSPSGISIVEERLQDIKENIVLRNILIDNSDNNH